MTPLFSCNRVTPPVRQDFERQCPEDRSLGFRHRDEERCPKPDTSTPEALKRLLLDVKSTACTDPKSGGVSGVLFVSVLDKLGIAEEVNKKSKLVTGMHNSELVAKGEVELAVQASHEILAVPRPIHLDAVRVSKRLRVFSCSIREPGNPGDIEIGDQHRAGLRLGHVELPPPHSSERQIGAGFPRAAASALCSAPAARTAWP